jgi:hypothetical protein
MLKHFVSLVALTLTLTGSALAGPVNHTVKQGGQEIPAIGSQLWAKLPGAPLTPVALSESYKNCAAALAIYDTLYSIGFDGNDNSQLVPVPLRTSTELAVACGFSPAFMNQNRYRESLFVVYLDAIRQYCRPSFTGLLYNSTGVWQTPAVAPALVQFQNQNGITGTVANCTY